MSIFVDPNSGKMSQTQDSTYSTSLQDFNAKQATPPAGSTPVTGSTGNVSPMSPSPLQPKATVNPIAPVGTDYTKTTGLTAGQVPNAPTFGAITGSTEQDMANAGYQKVTPPTNSSADQGNQNNQGNNGVKDNQGAQDNTKNNNDNDQKILSQLNSGVADAQAIATNSGLDLKTVQDALLNNPDYANMAQKITLTNTYNTQLDTYTQKMKDIVNGTFDLTDDEKNQIKGVQDMYDQMRQDMLRANQSNEGTLANQFAAGGFQEFAAQQVSGAYNQLVDKGVTKIKDLENEALSKVSALKQAFKDNDYKQVKDLYDTLQANLKDKSAQIEDIHKATAELQKRQTDALKADQVAATAALNQQKIKADIATQTIAPILLNNLTGDQTTDQQTIDDLSKYYDIDKNTIIGAYSAAKTKADAEKQKSDLAQQKVDASNNKLIPKTYKGVTTWYNAQGQQVNPETGQPVSSSGKVAPQNTPTPTPKTSYTKAQKQKLETQFGSDWEKTTTRAEQLQILNPSVPAAKQATAVNNAIATLQSKGSKAWGSTYNTLTKAYPDLTTSLTVEEKAQYPGNETRLDVILGKNNYK